jgi:hypothetical protein
VGELDCDRTHTAGPADDQNRSLVGVGAPADVNSLEH